MPAIPYPQETRLLFYGFAARTTFRFRFEGGVAFWEKPPPLFFDNCTESVTGQLLFYIHKKNFCVLVLCLRYQIELETWIRICLNLKKSQKQRFRDMSVHILFHQAQSMACHSRKSPCCPVLFSRFQTFRS